MEPGAARTTHQRLDRLLKVDGRRTRDCFIHRVYTSPSKKGHKSQVFCCHLFLLFFLYTTADPDNPATFCSLRSDVEMATIKVFIKVERPRSAAGLVS